VLSQTKDNKIAVLGPKNKTYFIKNYFWYCNRHRFMTLALQLPALLELAILVVFFLE